MFVPENDFQRSDDHSIWRELTARLLPVSQLVKIPAVLTVVKRPSSGVPLLTRRPVAELL